MRGESTLREEDRGQSGVLGVALITALVVVGTVGIIALGTGVLADARGDAQIESAEQAMTKLDATAALVALGRADTQRATVSLQGVGEYIDVSPNEGWMNITIVNRDSGSYESTVMNRSLGSVTYRNGDTAIAYQGGGVWKQVGNGSVMVSPPEFHYRGNTLTLPLISVANVGEGVPSGDLVLKSTESRNQTYPDPSAGYLNPLPKEKQVNVTVHSEYYDAWGRFFAQRTDGSVMYDHANETVIVELVVPQDFPFSAPVIATEENGVNIHGNCGGDTGCGELYNHEDYPLADEEIEQKIDDCLSSGCEDQTETDTSGLTGPNTYYYPSGLDSDSFTVDTSGGNVSLVVDGDMDIKDITVQGEGKVRVYVKGDVAIAGNANINSASDNTADQFVMFVHSSGVVDFNGKGTFKGLIYAPGSHADFNGKGTFVGSIVGETVDVNGKPSNNFTFPGEFQLGLGGPNTAYINYLYVSSIDLQINGTGS